MASQSSQTETAMTAAQLEEQKVAWKTAETAMKVLKDQMKPLRKKQKAAKQFFSAYIEQEGLEEIVITSGDGEEKVFSGETKERVKYDEDSVAAFLEDPSRLEDFKEQNTTSKRSFGVKKRKIEETSE
jgi:hypothetical protein